MARAKAELGTVAPPPRRAATPGRKPKRRAQPVPARPVHERRYRQTVRHVDLWSVLKIAICFYLTALITLVVSGVVLWWIATAAGVVENVEEFMGELVSEPDFEFLSWEVLRASTLVGLVVVCLMVVCTVLAAAFYNLFSELIGGVEVTVVEDEQPPS
jgi:hypothetical protein